MSNSQTFTFVSLPTNTTELQALPQAGLSTPFETAALTVLALIHYPKHRENALAMLSVLAGSRELSAYDKQFLADRFYGKDYVPRSYLAGTSPQNNYEPATPYQITITANAHSYEQANYAKLYLQSSGADSPRPVVLRLAKDGKWYLWEQMLLADIRKPAGDDLWA